MTAQQLRGFVGQGMDGQRRSASGAVFQYPPGAYTFRPPKAGYWKFVLWGPGGMTDGALGGGSGAYCEYARFLDAAQCVDIVVGAHGVATTATFPDGRVVSAGAGGDGLSPMPGAGGAASGGDVNLAGSGAGNAGGGTGGGAAGGVGSQHGAGAPANQPFRGGRGGSQNANGGNATMATSPGGGTGQTAYASGAGLAIVLWLRA